MDDSAAEEDNDGKEEEREEETEAEIEAEIGEDSGDNPHPSAGLNGGEDALRVVEWNADLSSFLLTV